VVSTRLQITSLEPFAGIKDAPLIQAILKVADADTAIADLDFGVTSRRQDILPDAALRVRKGFGLAWVEETPVHNAFGEAQITATVTDGETTSTAVANARILPVNDPPQATLIPQADRVHQFITTPTALTESVFASFEPGTAPFEPHSLLAYTIDQDCCRALKIDQQIGTGYLRSIT
jgi:hypothetical protein